LTQVFGDKTPSDQVVDEDIISSIKFDTTGDYLSVGDKAGRLVIFDVQ
jgi:serine/threonine-protein phosphatase 2A regulatory subunit B